jgi:hypothetical protein
VNAGPRLSGAASDVQLQRRRGLGVRFVVRVLADDSQAIADEPTAPMAPFAGVTRFADQGERRRYGTGHAACRHLPELSCPRQLRLDQRADARADVTLHAGDARVRTGLMRHILGLHRHVTGRAAERRALHVVQAAIRPDGHDEDVDERQGKTASTRER